jgi:hypothetical protein
MDFLLGSKVLRPMREISTPSVERTLLEKRQLRAPGSGTVPGSTAFPRAAAASSAVISEQASRVFGAPLAGVPVAPVAPVEGCVVPDCVPPAGVPFA